MPEFSFLIILGALVGGFVSGLTGFGTGLVALPFWLQVIPPVLASPLVVICSLAAQLQTVRGIWHAMDFRRLAPFVAGGVLGVPIGTWALGSVPVGPFKAAFGALLVVVSASLLVAHRQPKVTRGGRTADGLVGLCGGFLGGLAGLSGPVPTIWAGLRGWSRDERRAVMQGFNLTILGLSFGAQLAAGYITESVGWLVLAALPGTVIGAWIGRRCYASLNVERFNQVVLVLLMAAGVSMIVTQIWA